MSETAVTVAPQGAAPSAAPAPHSSEVPINPNPASSPNPVGSQAPDKPVSGRNVNEAVQRAFDRANEPSKATRQAERPPAKAAEAKAGHNQPPEETPPASLDLKKRPGDQPRSERGTFAPRQRQDATNRDGNVATNEARNVAPGEQNQTYKRLPPHAPFSEPPQRISERARRDWADTPETVRGDMHRMHQEFGQAYQAYRADHEAMNAIRPFHQMAQQHGTTLDKALGNYVSMEQKLRADPIGGLDVIVNNLNLVDPRDGSKIDFRRLCYHVVSQTPEQLRQVQQGNVQSAAAQQIGALHQKISGLENHLQQMHTAQQFNYTRSQVDRFAETHPRIDEELFGNTVTQELQLGFNLETAYRRAEMLHPATHAAQTRTTPAQTRPADRSIYGAPDVTASDAASRRPREPSKSPYDAVQKAVRAMNGQL